MKLVRDFRDFLVPRYILYINYKALFYIYTSRHDRCYYEKHNSTQYPRYENCVFIFCVYIFTYDDDEPHTDNLKRVLKEYHNRIAALEDKKFDIEYVVKKKDYEVHMREQQLRRHIYIYIYNTREVQNNNNNNAALTRSRHNNDGSMLFLHF